MNEVQSGKTKIGLLKWAIAGLGIVGILAVLYVIGSAAFKSQSGPGVSSFKTGTLAKIAIPQSPLATTDIPFRDGEGKPVKLSDFRGKVVVLNLWATWCAPCQTEMPSLARLAAAYQGKPVEVVALSVDRDTDLEDVKKFIAKHAPLKVYRDPGYKVAFGLQPRAEGFPTTIIYDAKGRERARMSGEADWSSSGARGLIDFVASNP
jgi:thiol-disulfide isomerase/thioredoxin